jgi:acetaldehyde dehydrogenase (acetylating)
MLQDKDLISIQEVRTKVEKAWAAASRFRSFSQEQIDGIVEAMAAAARLNSVRLAELAVEETGYGNARDKVAKNLLNCDILPRRMRGMKLVGVLRESRDEGIIEIGVPVGVVAAILPTTNPTSTAIYKTLISLKAGNAIVISPHPNAMRCTCETAAVMYQAALEAGAPEDIIQCINFPSIEGTNALMRHERTGVILATGGQGIVNAAYSSGNPAFGVGPGNVPVLIEKSADVADAIAKVVEGKSFDYGTVCSSEQAIVAEAVLRDSVISELKKQNAYFCTEEQKSKLRHSLLTPKWTVNPKFVGQSPRKIGELAGFQVPESARILVVELNEVGKGEPLSAEKLSPVISLYFVKDFAEGLTRCESLLRFGGLGHTCVVYSRDDARIREFGTRMPAYRVLVNTPAPHGSTGITTNVFPSMTLGCGAIAGNITSDNVGPQHLMNIKRIAFAVRDASTAFEYNPGVSGTTTVTRAQVVAAVEKFLAQRGISTLGTAGPSTGAVVDEVLARLQNSPVAPEAKAGCGCSCAHPAAPAPSPTPSVTPPEPEQPVVDFVCEADVRNAAQAAKKIFIGPKTIVTPSAQDLAKQHNVLVLAQK